MGSGTGKCKCPQGTESLCGRDSGPWSKDSERRALTVPVPPQGSRSLTAAGDAQVSVSEVESPLRAGKHHPVYIIGTSEHSLGPEGSSQVKCNEAGEDHRAGESVMTSS